ncbi:40S ribosomal protein S13-1 [Acorus gramineus]|uniref:40S ribosomal protein S13-1 n=1 Tax=Acorus gramineus TaxID=55184 RepID=A0AAV9B9L1_ACOGR|nr:40S ribosomal protein S13-1 [Acorus gramineus]
MQSGLAPEIPEDLYHLIKKAVAIRKHLERNRKDKDSKFRLFLVENRIHCLARYYKRTKKLPPPSQTPIFLNWSKMQLR